MKKITTNADKYTKRNMIKFVLSIYKDHVLCSSLKYTKEQSEIKFQPVNEWNLIIILVVY